MENHNSVSVPENNTTPALEPISEDRELAYLLKLQKDARERLGLKDDPAPRTIAGAMPAKLVPVMSEEEILRRHEFDARLRRSEAFDALIGQAGRRYADVTLESFQLSATPDVAKQQAVALATVTLLGQNLAMHVKAGGNVLFFGPPGTGKDHLMMALLRAAILNLGLEVRWCNGQDVAGEFRDAIDSETPESRVIRRYTEATILAISDPVPPKGDASNYAANMLYRIIGTRDRNNRGTWVTMNVANSEDANMALSAPVFDRLRDNAVTVFCNWPSYRAANKPKWLGS